MKNRKVKLIVGCILTTIFTSCGTDCTNIMQNSAYMSGYDSGKKGAVDVSEALVYWEAAENADGNHNDLVKEKSSFEAGYDDGAQNSKCKCEGIDGSHW